MTHLDSSAPARGATQRWAAAERCGDTTALPTLYGWFYGPGATDDLVEPIRKRQFPLVGSGAGYRSWVHHDDAAAATVLAVEQKATGVFNIVDNEPAAANEWLARLLAGEVAVTMMTNGRGFSNAHAKEELGWELAYATWRQGFKAELATTQSWKEGS